MAIAGKVALTPKGVWSADTTYEKLDIVSHNGSAYVSRKADNVGNEPTNDEFWMFMISSGSGGGESPDVSALEALVEKIISGEKTVGKAEDSNKLGGETSAEWNAKISTTNTAVSTNTKSIDELKFDVASVKTSVTAIVVGTTPVAKATDADTVGGLSPSAFVPTTGAVMGGALYANEEAQATLETSQVRNISIGTVDMTPGETELAVGEIYFFYEEPPTE